MQIKVFRRAYDNNWHAGKLNDNGSLHFNSSLDTTFQKHTGVQSSVAILEDMLSASMDVCTHSFIFQIYLEELQELAKPFAQ